MSLISIGGSLSAANFSNKAKDYSAMDGYLKRHIILLGASISRAWHIELLPDRINTNDFVFEFIDGSSFDKSEKLREILLRRQGKPNAIFLKECAAYFPGNLPKYTGLMEQWIKECSEAGIIPIPTTVIPVTRFHSLKKFMIDIMKFRNPLKYGNPFKHKRNAGVLEYNDWIRKYCRDHGLSYLDLEEALCYSKRNRYLREDLARVDGLHLNRKAYKILDQIIVSTLEKVNWGKS